MTLLEAKKKKCACSAAVQIAAQLPLTENVKRSIRDLDSLIL